MKVLVTVGSSPFESLIRAADFAAEILPHYEFIFQINNGIYKPKNGTYFSFSETFSTYIDEANIIISHAGAGTVFELLEKEKRCIIVPNYERIDKHQSDLTSYIEKNELAIVCHELHHLSTSIKEVNNFKAKKYSKEPFFMTKELINLFS
ncbi:PssE/Cps14G family polysaccharide biosynthesis glycosyltransferase [Pseudoalteromonas sp. TB64]|uniref:PssE/Cps14G family polysaccharide biosynthesis glycosyltransferase n=1 Tax=Pseudoalteromonas sp. TB64 TaxID=1938600 RepID=UPI000407B2EE|nr:PssE/Cps14G family polysaccharide biosynthesis glycosyltransferase [Pseudoalteromonas sp. TB64]